MDDKEILQLEKERLIVRMIAYIENSGHYNVADITDDEEERMYDYFIWWRYTLLMRKHKDLAREKMVEMRQKYPHLFKDVWLGDYSSITMGELFHLDHILVTLLFSFTSDEVDKQIERGEELNEVRFNI